MFKISKFNLHSKNQHTAATAIQSGGSSSLRIEAMHLDLPAAAASADVISAAAVTSAAAAIMISQASDK